MVREATITQEQVNAVADGLRAQGIKPTARAVREQLGAGSMATVLRFLQAWLAGQAKPTEPPVTLPAALQRALVDFLSQEVQAARVELQRELAALQEANGELISEIERQAGTLTAQTEELAQVQTEKSELAGRLQQMERDLIQAREEVADARRTAEAARTELAKTQLRLEAVPRLESDLNRLREELSQERNARIEADQKAAVAAARLEVEITARQRAETELVTARADVRKATETALEALKGAPRTK